MNLSNTRNYPAFIIDRSRRNKASRFADDFVVCTDRECGFIARAYRVERSRSRDAIIRLREEIETRGYKFFECKFLRDEVAVILQIETFIPDIEPCAFRPKIVSLLKKAIKAYLYGEAIAVQRDGLAYDNQIAALEDVIRLAESQRPRMIEMNGPAATASFIDALRAAKDSISFLQKIITRNESD